MLTHSQIWAGVDTLAARHGMTASGLARKAGLDPTTFNRSKRVAPDGRQRWPSTESIAKILDATGASLAEFLNFVHGDNDQPVRSLRRTDFSVAGRNELFDVKGHPLDTGWDALVFPNLDDPAAYALEISDDSLLPVYRDGEVIVISPAAPVRRGDRILVKTSQGNILTGELRRRTAKTVEVRAFNPQAGDRVLPIDEVIWLSRIIWASQ
jgi:phage repressor protein C with HTH and peptisase S24 domain